jgi:hypothetical protein
MVASTTIAVLSNGSTSVEIIFQKLEHDYDNQLTVITIPKNKDADGNPLVWNIDLGRQKQVITLDGYLLEETGSTALAKKQAFESIVFTPASLTLSWLIGTTTITKTGSVLKCKITEVPYMIGDQHPTTQAKSFMVALQFSVGNIKGVNG